MRPPSFRRSTSRMIGKTYFARNEAVQVVCRWNGGGPHNVLIEYADGRRVVRPFRGLRTRRNPQR
jgi:hypothetical protein